MGDVHVHDTERILLVDDSRLVLVALKRALAGHGFDLHTAGSGEEALDRVREVQPALVLLDIIMPGIDGYETCQRLKASPDTSAASIIFLSGRDDVADKVRGFEVGAVDYINKPFQEAEVVARVTTHLTVHRLRRDLQESNAALRELNEGLELKVQERTEELLRSHEAIIFALAKLTESRDDDTGQHLERICYYTRILARELCKTQEEIDEDWIRTVTTTAALHDIGKVGTPDAVLLKDGPLDSGERKVIQLHPCTGGDTLLAIKQQLGENPFLSIATEIALCHHERWDGSGYPYGLAGEAIPLSARIVALADVYDALTSKRSYKDAFPHDKALAIICEGDGSHFDPAVVEAFRAVESEFQAVASRMH